MMAVSADHQLLSRKLEMISTEYQICRRKLESKNEALLIMSKELDQCRSERDQFKLMAEQVRDRYQMLKRQLTGDTPVSPSHADLDAKTFSDIQSQSLARLLFVTKETNKSMKFEIDDLKQKLQDAEGDIKLLREQIVRSRVGTTDEGLNIRHFPAHEREDLVKQLETRREEYVQLERDLQQVLDEKEELETARDAYRTKNERLNTELNYILGGDERRIVDVDALNMENRYLNERLKQMEEEKTMAIETVTKYKSILEKKNSKGGSKLGQSRTGGLVITQKQVSEITQSRSLPANPHILADLQGLCTALLDTINDKNLALSHQRKTNKLLGNRVNELEKKLKTLEVSGLWSHNVSANHQNNIEKLMAECEEIKTLVPRRLSQSTDVSESDFSMSEPSSVKSSPAHQPHHALSRLDLEELEAAKGQNREFATSDRKSPQLTSQLTSTSSMSPIRESDIPEEPSLDTHDPQTTNHNSALSHDIVNNKSDNHNLSNSNRTASDNTADRLLQSDELDISSSSSSSAFPKTDVYNDDLKDSCDDSDVVPEVGSDNEDVAGATEEFTDLMGSLTDKLVNNSKSSDKQSAYTANESNRDSSDEDSEVFGTGSKASKPALVDVGSLGESSSLIENDDNESCTKSLLQEVDDTQDDDLMC